MRKLILLFAIILLVGCSSAATPKITAPRPTSTPSPIASNDVDIQDGWSAKKMSSIGSVIFTGEVKNTSTRYTYEYLKIKATVYDGDGNQIGSDWGYLDSTSLPPGAFSSFTVYVDCNVSKADKVKLSVIE